MAIKEISTTALVPYTAGQIYELVIDAESYPEFLPGCRSVEIHERETDRVVATVSLAKGRIKKSFTTENRFVKDERIDMHLVKGPFHHLEGRWDFEPLGEEGCRVSFQMEFEFSNKLLAMSVAPILHEIAHALVGVFIKRAERLYGKR